MLVALLAIAIGATILSGLVTIYYDVPRQMGAQFRNYGANMILVPPNSDARFDQNVVNSAVSAIDKEDIVGVAPYRYESVVINEQPVIAAATDMDGAKSTSPYWYVNGNWPAAKGQALVGKELAEKLGLKADSVFNVEYDREDEAKDKADKNGGMEFFVAGILETGGSEENYVFLSLGDMDELTGESGRLDVAELSVSAPREKLESYAEKIGLSGSVKPRLVKRVTQSETTVLTKLQALVFLVTAVVLLLTMICVATTMMAVVTERRKEIGLRKALGASDAGIMAEFMGEGLLLGGIGGLLGSGLGFAFAQTVSRNVFNSSIAFQPLILPLTIAVSVLVTGLACLLPVRNATDVDPALVLKGE